MSFVALAVVVEAVDLLLPPLDDEEFGLDWKDIEAPPFEVVWTAYRSIAGHVISGATDLRIPHTLDALCDAWAKMPCGSRAALPG